MPIKPKYKKVLDSMIEQYGKKKGTSVFYATMKKKRINYTKETKCSKLSIEVKEDSDEFYTKGYIATTHIDDSGDKIQKETLDMWATQINNKNTTTPVSIHHDREDSTLIGLPVSESATVKQLDDGQHGLYVETHYNQTHPEFENVKYEIDNGFLSNYSIEYDTHDNASTFEADVDGQTVRILTPETDLVGYGVASPRTAVNKEAELYKEVVNMTKEMNKDEKLKKKKEEEEKMKDKKEEVEEKPEAPQEEPKAEEAPVEAKPAEEENTEEVSEEEEGKESVKTQVKEETIKEMVKAEVKEMMNNKPIINEPEKKEKVEVKEFKEYKEGVIEKKASTSEQWKLAAKLHNKMIADGKEFSCSGTSLPFECKEREGKHIVELKAANYGLQVADNYTGAQTTWANIYANYEVYPAELGNVYQPVIINQLNDAIATWNILPKDDFSNSSTITFRARTITATSTTGRNSTAGGYSEDTAATTLTNTDFDGWTGRLKCHEIFAYYRVLVSVSGPMMQFARAAGGIGDVYADEIKWSTNDLLKVINSAILSTGAGTAENACLGFESLMTTSGTIFAHAKATYTLLQAGGNDNMSSAAITLKKMRAMIRTVTTNGARREDLVFICDPLQEDFVKALIQDMQRITPTSGRVGFTGNIELDGVPIFSDIDCNTDDLFLVDTQHTRIGISVPPVYEELGKDSDARRGFIKTYFNLYCTAPNHNYWIYGLATS